MLSSADIDFYEEHGYLVLPGQFSAAESELLLGETRRLSQLDIPQRILESDGEQVRSVYAVHQHSDAFDRFTRDPRNLEPARELLGGDVYIHQTQLNPKAPFQGDVWEWHQDYLYWQRDDGMAEPRALNVSVFLDEVTEFNGPIFVMPGSHRLALDDETRTHQDGWENTLTADIRHKITPDTLSRLADRLGLVSIKGDPGTTVVFDGRLLHCSPPNLSGNPRSVIFIRYNSVDNPLREVPAPRPEWLASRDPRPLGALSHPFADADAAG
ncbi:MULTISPECIES: phytanoyl-CoA dioxygenase family protein [unclassified Streptomyces]|uniref:phytanoyl-CoA dioxygenase family protein n=1 Tax=unclassified Streptomyces TaxID=2593676 RepID=UPI002E3640DD|nr:phytanoyl-CoA dioxygenase family protein [Streptomyces sp. NBC_01477]